MFQSTTDAVLCPNCERAPIPGKKKANVHVVDGSNHAARKEFSANLTAEKAAEKAAARSPKRRRITPTEDTSSTSSPTTAQPTRAKRSSTGGEHRSKPAQNFTLVKLIALWFIALIGIAFFIKYRLDALRPPVSIVVDDNPQEDAALLSKNIDVANQSNPLVMATANEFFQTTAPEKITQLCRKRPRLTQTIFNDAAKATLFRPESSPQLIARNVIRIGETPMVETIWKDDRNRQVEIVFGQQEDQWLIDWESFAKSSTMPWSVFQAEKEDGEGTFRMLVRQRLAKEDTSDLLMSVMFYEPGFFHGSNLGLATPEFSVDRQSQEGKMILAALKAREEEKPIYGSMFPANDPPSTARVTVKIRRIVDDKGKSFELVDVLACHWLGIEDAGVDLTHTP